MRIISGKYKGHPLVSFTAGHIRPTTDRVKETLFNIWQNELEACRALDLFSGTGNLGLEALSRGAKSVVFVDAHPKSIGILRQNVDKLKVEEDFEIVNNDVFRFLKRGGYKAFDLIFIDPPFTEVIADKVLQALSEAPSFFHPGTLIAIESARREKVVDNYGALERYREREFGDKLLSLFKVRSQVETSTEPQE